MFIPIVCGKIVNLAVQITYYETLPNREWQF